jgi:hypothetical protein
MLAQLKRVEPAHAGRIVLVVGPATTVKAPGQAFPLLAWRVTVMGRDLDIDDIEVSELIVAEVCLQPLCQLAPDQARELIMALAERTAEAAICAFGQALQANPMDQDELDAELLAAAREALARWRSPPALLPVE